MIPQLQRQPAAAAPESAPRWSLATRILFRFGFSYFLLYVYPRQVGSLGANINYSNPLRNLWHAVVPWVGTHILHVTGDFREVANGSGDQLYDYVLLFCIAVTAALAAVIWSWLDRTRPNYDQLHQWLRLFVRLIVAVAMISYGANKLFRMQFAEPGLARYVDTFGQTSPMGLLWTMMGTSRAYSFFGGVGEMIGGLLLLVPRFTTLGALVTGAVMSNVLMLNLCYDVPRKIYSIHLIAFCLFLLLPDMRRLVDFFLLNRPSRLSPSVPLFKDKKLNYGAWALQAAIGIGAIILCSSQGYSNALKAAAHLQGPLRGIWTVDELVMDGIVRPPLVSDARRWQRIVFDVPDKVTVQAMDGSQKDYYLQFDSGQQKFKLWDVDDPHWKTELSFDYPDRDHLTLVGEIGGRAVSAKASRVNLADPVKFLLINRGMHWVTDYPHNR